MSSINSTTTPATRPLPGMAIAQRFQSTYAAYARERNEGNKGITFEVAADIAEYIDYMTYLDQCKTLNVAEIAGLTSQMEKKWTRPRI